MNVTVTPLSRLDRLVYAGTGQRCEDCGEAPRVARVQWGNNDALLCDYCASFTQALVRYSMPFSIHKEPRP